VTIHSIQPLVVSLLILIWIFALSRPIFGAAILVLLILMIGMVVQYYIQRRSIVNDIVPISEKSSHPKPDKELMEKEFADVMTSVLPDSRARSSSESSTRRKVDVIRRESHTRPRLHSDASSGRRRLSSYESEDGSLVDDMLESYFDVSSDETDSDDM